ncbi:MAG: hypothetical protein H0V29_01650 [Thermoleophilaceae bacterium]|nr:hypothetical protein [Thermoleophilaceae bacterium]
MARIALDIDSTLHHYWDLIERVVLDRHGIEIPYEKQTGWGIAALDRDQAVAVIQETHSEANILAGEPYPGAVDTVRRWHGESHWIHVTSHRAEETHGATTRWLEQIGMPYDDLFCSYDKVTRCVELGIDVLVDDSPVNIERALEAGIVPATIVHPWNEALVARGHVVAGKDWPELAAALHPVLARD